MSRSLYIGLMSGTSVDGIDAVVADFSTDSSSDPSSRPGKPQCRVLHSLCQPFAEELKASIQHSIQHPEHISLDSLGALDIALGHAYADTVLALLEHAQLAASDIVAIGNHGQTLRHQPDSELPFSLQIGNAAVIAERTGITTVADFRSRDIAAGGQGAPLVPAFHQTLFADKNEVRVILNIGGIANITILDGEQVQGFDTGPGNTLMDAVCQSYADRLYDEHGSLAASGTVQPELLDALLAHPYFQQVPPKSTGRKLFNLEWLQSYLRDTAEIHEADLLSTLCSLSAYSIAADIRRYAPHCQRVLVCGGGAHNTHLMQLLSEQLPCPVASTTEYGLAPDWVEAAAFAWLGRQTINGAAGNLPSATGAQGERILGAIYPA